FLLRIPVFSFLFLNLFLFFYPSRVDMAAVCFLGPSARARSDVCFRSRLLCGSDHADATVLGWRRRRKTPYIIIISPSLCHIATQDDRNIHPGERIKKKKKRQGPANK